MVVLGIDPGIAIMGVGVIHYEGNKFKPLYYGAIKTSSKDSTDNRLRNIYNQLLSLIEEFKPDAVVIEELFFNNNAKTAFLVGQARGVAILAASINNTKIYEYTPLQVKQGVVGYGRADKKQVQQMIKILLCLEEAPKPDDVADALAIAICHVHSGNFKEMFLIK
ncbi:crossover junction endodeoxyribonuclease RuvC [Alkaliphilus serpentinus]|uniref:Crossover junction endodeoxyribonuclease RuvC n=1 Tax=Alkaliphilus serpentinus TaxID=1482731 RepID=A0A833M6M7_9FIRM|nr:crossover junction endodeoxyribonuclease RuvC [Alkaliphilus serpentinus]KAB3527683.1 crossover junction endodeoxyribonuclease RuvC [Alkaliphilus serpentinus]